MFCSVVVTSHCTYAHTTQPRLLLHLHSSLTFLLFVCFSMIEISILPDNKEKCLEAIPGLVLMLQSTDTKKQNIAARAISNIANTSTTKVPIINHGALPPLIGLLRHDGDASVMDGAVLALMYISNAPDTKCLVVEQGLLPPLFALLVLESESAEDLKENVISILAGLVLLEANHAPMIEACSFPVLLAGITQGSSTFKERCIFILSTLSYNPTSRQALVDGGVVSVFKPLLHEQEGSQFTKELSVALYANICHIKTAQVQIVNEGVLPLLMQVAQNEVADKADMKQRVGWVLQNVRHLVIRKTATATAFATTTTAPSSSSSSTSLSSEHPSDTIVNPSAQSDVPPPLPLPSNIPSIDTEDSNVIEKHTQDPLGSTHVTVTELQAGMERVGLEDPESEQGNIDTVP